MSMFLLLPLIWGAILLALAELTSRQFPAVFGLLNGGRTALLRSKGTR
jgi:hypothetical protein